MRYIAHVVADLFNLVSAGGKTHWPQFNSPIQPLHRQFCRLRLHWTINVFLRASFNPKYIFNHTTKAGPCQKSILCIVHSGMCAGECKLFTYRYGDRQLCYFKIWCCCLETMSCVKPEMAPNIEHNSSHSAQFHPCLHSYWLISKWIQSKIRSLVRM